MIKIIGGFLIIGISALFLWAYTYEPPYNLFWIILYSCFLILGIAQTIIGMAQNKIRR